MLLQSKIRKWKRKAKCELRRGTILLLLLAMFGQIFEGEFIILDYLTHQESYAALCINKNKPEMHCHGRCQMEKKAQNNAKEDAPAVLIASVNVVQFCFIDGFQQLLPIINYGSGKIDYPFLKGLLTSAHHPEVQPPEPLSLA